MEREVLISKIEKLQENIKNQSKIAQIDIDLQLSYLRELYDAYLELKYKFTDASYHIEKEVVIGKTTTPLSDLLSDCGTLSLFDEEEEEGESSKLQVPSYEAVENEKITPNNNVESPLEEENPPININVEVPAIENEENLLYNEVSSFVDNEDSYLTEKEDDEDDEAEEEEEENEEEGIEMPSPSVETDIEVEFPTFDVPSKPEQASDIDLDDIEFEDENPEDEMERIENTIPVFPTGMLHSRYYGDEIDIETSIPVKPITVGERFKNEKPSLNEIVSSYKIDESIGSKLQQGNISDLMKSIDMNHKFLFVKELFKGNGSTFTEEINTLNNFRKLNEALPYLESIKEKYKWENQSEAYSELYRLVLRKFAK